MSSKALPLRLAIIANEQTPYRLHLHRRICREMPEIELWSLFTHEVASSPWRYEDDPEIRPVLFGRDELSTQRQTLAGIHREWAKGGEIVRWLETHNIQAIVLFGYNDPARLRIVRWAALRDVPCFLFGDSNIRCDRSKGFRGWLKRRYVPWILRQTAGVFHFGRLGREYFERYGVPPDRLYAFPYEPDYDLFSGVGPEGTAAARQRHGLTEGRRNLLFSGRMIAAKRPDLVVDAFERLAHERTEWDLVMVGDGPLREELQRRATGPSAKRIHWLGFIADPKALAELYAACHVFVLPSDFEPWGVVLTEAATGMALVASSAVGAAADLIEDGVNGRVFPHGDVDQLRQVLLDVTAPRNLGRMRAASSRVLSRWREASSPIHTLQRSLEKVGLLRYDGFGG